MNRVLYGTLPAFLLAAALAAPAGAAAVQATAASEARVPSSYAAGSAASPSAAAAPILAVPGLAPSISAFSTSISAPALQTPISPTAASVAPLPVAAAAPRQAAGEVLAVSAAAVPGTAAPISALAVSAAAAQIEGRALGALRASGAGDAAEATPGNALNASHLFDGTAARSALERAAEIGYTVTVLRKHGDGGDRLAVILGESHIKSAEEDEIGRGVVARFTNYALEGSDAESTWARRFNRRMQERAARSLIASNPAKYGRGSTIEAAHQRTAALADLRPHLPGLSPEDHASMPTSTPPPPAGSFPLEIGHRPDAAEKIAVWVPTVGRAYPSIPIVMHVFMAGTLISAFASLTTAVFVCMGIISFLSAFILYMRLGDRLWSFRPHSRLSVLFPLQFGIINARDKTMAANLARALESLPGGARLLAIVGMAHTPGIRRHLVEEHGYEDVGLDALSRE